MSAAEAMSTRDELRRDEPMAKHTSWRVGGPADLYFRPATRAALLEFLTGLDPDVPVYWLGLGSNLLVRDGGIRGVVIATARALGTAHRLDGGLVEAEAGVPCTALARRCARWGLGPAEFFAGIPGTVGGALRMNAGAFGGETWDRLKSVETVDRAGTVRCRGPQDYVVGYREVRGPAGEWFLSAQFEFDDQPGGGLDRVKTLLRERQDKQPLGLPSCGSVFRNPPGDHAARLIESAGLKGFQIGGAQVSEKHANFIINTGEASATDIETLINAARDRVAQRFGVNLVAEVHIVGEAGGVS
ncbi:MAG: UDP-N-acetylmuramate dehydrogenase [Gammaproteobacteria bacterium]|nr:UDP-N-acetylmuramate dehydrogenase [Gammaproteobacteria bacterium]